MKIIFDSEEQKKAFFEYVVVDYCPSIFGLDRKDVCNGYLCDDCWEKCGIELEVKNEN